MPQLPTIAASQTSSAPSPAVSPGAGWSHGGPFTVSIIGGSLVSPFGSLLPLKQLRGFGLGEASFARSPFVGFPYPPLSDSLLSCTRLPYEGKLQTDPEPVPPWQFVPGGGVSVSGNSCVTIPQALLWSTVLFLTAS